MESSNRVKSFNWKNEKEGSKNRIRFLSSKERSKRATADVYRAYKRRGGSTSVTREERVHAADKTLSSKKLSKKRRMEGDEEEITLYSSTVSNNAFDHSDDEDELDVESIFASELDLAQDRNVSEEYTSFYREIWSFTRSLAELLHHMDSVIDCLMSHMLTTKTCTIEKGKNAKSSTITGYVVNYATKDILHLIGVLARDLRHEIHPYLYQKILPRIAMDLLNPPSSQEWLSHHHLNGYVVEVEVVELAFRTLSYCFRYDSDKLLNGPRVLNNESQLEKEEDNDTCLEQMRQFYGATLAHKREPIRRLAAECFAPLIQKLKPKEKKRHLKRVIRALATVCSSTSNKFKDKAISARAQRAQSDALDGISMLLFCISKGIPGRLHTKAQLVFMTIFECISSPGKGGNQTQKQRIISSLSIQYFSRICYYVNVKNFNIIWDELHKALKDSVHIVSKQYTIFTKGDNGVSSELENNYVTSFNALGHIADLLNTCISFKDGVLCQKVESERLSNSIHIIFKSGCYWNIPSFSSNHYFVQNSILQLLCTSWNLYPNDPSFASKIPQYFSPIINSYYGQESINDKIEKQVDPAYMLSTELLPHLPSEVVMKTLSPAILNAAAKQLKMGNANASLVLVQSVANVQPQNSSTNPNEKNTEDLQQIANDMDEICPLFFVRHAGDCVIDHNQRDSLIDFCLSCNIEDTTKESTKLVDYAQIGFAIRCIPFLTFVNCSGNDSKSASIKKKVFKWFGTILKQLEKHHVTENEKDEYIITKSLLIEALSIVSIECMEENSHKEIAQARTYLGKYQKFAYSFLKQYSTFVWVLKCISIFVHALEKASLPHIGELSSEPDEVFDLLNGNLRSESHIIRLCSLKILNSIPKKLFVVDHADLDLSEDLDEEPGTFRPGSNDTGQKDYKYGSTLSKLSGPCDLISTFLILEYLPLTLANERRIISQLNRAEVLCRSGKLPVAYAEAAANFMFGVLHVKFSPVWQPAIRVIVELSRSVLAGNDDEVLWQPLLSKLKATTFSQSTVNVSSERGKNQEVAENDDTLLESYPNDKFSCFSTEIINRHMHSCFNWSKSQGLDQKIFQPFHKFSGPRAARYSSTDSDTYFELVWSVMKEVPQLTVKKSRFIVPLFLEFLYYQYYGVDSQEPDTRELGFEDHVNFNREVELLCSKIKSGKKSSNIKLSSYLKMFAAVKGPKQLYKYTFLEKILIVQLSNTEITIAQLALSCLNNFKYAFLTPYSSMLNKMLTKGELREILTKFCISSDESAVDSHHRQQLLPIIIRILFGRLTARGKGSKSSKDTPTSRRGAILSFFSGLEQSNEELDSLVYLMVRVFIPPNISMKMNILRLEKETLSNDKINALILEAAAVQAHEVKKISVFKVIGFLNLLIDVVSKLGYGINKFIPVFYSILLTLCEYSSVNDGKDKIRFDSEKDEINAGVGTTETLSDDNKVFRLSNVRSLCYKCLSKLFEQFSASYEFKKDSARLWDHLKPAIQKLPISLIKAEKPSSLLLLLEVVSSHQSLIPLLRQSDDVIESIIMSITVDVKYHVHDILLRFIENLLTEGNTYSGNIDEVHNTKNIVGIELIEPHIHLLIEQFTKRIGNAGYNITANSAQVKQSKTIAAQSRNASKRELSILCRISGILVEEQIKYTTSNKEVEKQKDTLEILCRLLLSFLKFERGANDVIQLSILGIIKRLISRLRSAAALSFVTPLSKLLGPNKSKRGITSPQIRQEIISVLEAIAHTNDANFCYTNVSKILKDLNAMDRRFVMEFDFEKIIPVLNQLGQDLEERGSWYYLATNSQNKADASHGNESIEYKALVPLLYQCLNSLFDSDGVINRGAFKAIRVLIKIAGQCTKTIVDMEENIDFNPWLNLIENTLVPNINACLTSNDDSVRRYFILLVSEISQSFKHLKSRNLFAELSILIREDDAEQDFFLNITHVQIHRRCKALSTLRKYLSSKEIGVVDEGFIHHFSQHTLTNVLLRIALHPVFECTISSEETYALEGVATVGSIARRLAWNKYQTLLTKLLAQVHRKPTQERYIIGAICSVTDGFHFETLDDDMAVETSGKAYTGKSMEVEQSMQNNGNNVWRALTNRIIPQLEGNLLKEVAQRDGSRLKVLRPPIVLAVVKLLQKMPLYFFERKLPRLLILICDTLKSKDSNARDNARETLSRISVTLDFRYLSDIIHQLAVSLSEGYQLHVRSKTLHSIIHRISKEYISGSTADMTKTLPSDFDSCVPALMDLIQQDLFGTASEMKEVQDVQKRVIKEAVGVKSYDTLEMICKLINFDPSLRKSNTSSVHIIVRPILERLRLPDIDRTSIGKLKECLSRIVIGLSHNPTVKEQDVLPFIYSCVSPFILSRTAHDEKELSDYSSDSESEDKTKDINISGKIKNPGRNQKQKKSTKVVTWRPSTLKSASDSSEAQSLRKKQKQDLHKVKDGANAPKLTGKSRYGATKMVTCNVLSDPAKSSEVIFGLALLQSCLKRTKIDKRESEVLAMADPFIDILTICVKISKNNEVTLLSLKCLTFLLRWELPSVQKVSARLGSYTVDLLTTSGSSSNTRHEITQGCFKILTFLIKADTKIDGNDIKKISSNTDVTEDGKLNMENYLLNEVQMDSLISLLHTTVVDSEHQNATFGLIKAIVSSRYLSAEFYDLLEKILKLSVQSQKDTVRQQSSMIFVQFLIHYPLGKKRFETHLKQIVLNIKYEYESGRLSAIGLLSVVIEKLPSTLLEEFAQFFFLPLVLQLVNDDSDKCREAVSKSISSIFQRVSMDILQTLYDYMLRWSSESSSGNGGMQRASAQLLGIMVESRQDFLKRGSNASDLIALLTQILDQELNKSAFSSNYRNDDWELGYFCLICFEKINRVFPIVSNRHDNIWNMVIKGLTHDHLWIKQVASRIINANLVRYDPQKYSSNTGSSQKDGCIIYSIPGSLYIIAKGLCQQLDVANDQLTETISTLAIKSLTWIIQAMHYEPKLCFKENQIEDDENEKNPRNEHSKSPALWLMTRLSNIAKNKGELRREAVFKCFASFATSCPIEIISPHLDLMLIPLHRAYSEAENILQQKQDRDNYRDNDVDASSLDFLKEVLQVLEDKCGTEEFISVYTTIKNKAKERRDSRKQEIAAEAIRNPEAAAKRKIQKQLREKQRKKRRMNEKKMGIKRKKKQSSLA